MSTILLALLIIGHGDQGRPEPVTGPFLFAGVSHGPHHIAFALSGQIWLLPAEGGVASSVTTGTGDAVQPALSPDGRFLAYTKRELGDIFLLELNTGSERRITAHPGFDLPVRWTPDGKELIFLSNRFSRPAYQLFRIGLTEALPEPLPLPHGAHLAFEPNGQRMAYVPYGPPALFSQWDGYGGGMRPPLWLVDMEGERAESVVAADWDAHNPVWTPRGLFFTARKGGAANLYRFNPVTKKVDQLTEYSRYGIRGLDGFGDRLVWNRDGFLYAWDLKETKPQRLVCRVPLAFHMKRTRLINAARWVDNLSLTADGKRVCVSARGEVFLHHLKDRNNRNLTQTGAVREHGGQVSPDARLLAFFSDEKGHDALHVQPLDGTGPVVRIPLDEGNNDYRELSWSPDGKNMSFSDAFGRLWLADVVTSAAKVIDESDDPAQLGFEGYWSPGSRYLVYTRRGKDRLRRIWAYDSHTHERHPVTDGTLHSWNPRFDRNGQFLYYLTSPNAVAGDVGWSVLSAIDQQPRVATQLVALRLNDAVPSPVGGGGRLPNLAVDWQPESVDKPIEWEGLPTRLTVLPGHGRQWTRFEPGPAGVLFALANHWSVDGGWPEAPQRVLYRLDLRDPDNPLKWAHGVQSLNVAANEETVLVGTVDGWRLLTREGRERRQQTLSLGSLMARIKVSDEWEQIFWEANRFAKIYFYDPNLHGQKLIGKAREKDAAGNLPEGQEHALDRHFAAYLPNLTRRRDLTALLRLALGEIAVSHLRIGAGDEGERAQLRFDTGSLGADLSFVDGGFRIDRIFRPKSFEKVVLGVTSPLDLPGGEVVEGDYLISVNGRRIDGSKPFFAWLDGTAGEVTALQISSDPGGGNLRTVRVTPLAEESRLRMACWSGENREKVDRWTNGSVGYVHIPGFNESGIRAFQAGYYAARGRRALVIDQRFNGGGITSDRLIEMLRRDPLYAYRFRFGTDVTVPLYSLDAPKVLLINQWNGSAAETFALMFKLGRLGKVVGRTTAGAGIGGHGFQPTSTDGARLTIPNRAAYDPAGTWGIENTGVRPDEPVPLKPNQLFVDRDAMLRMAVDVALAQADLYRKRDFVSPPYPDYSGTKRP